MAYLSCEWIEYRLVLDHWELKFCCKPHSGNKGFVPICHFSGGSLPVETIRNEREKLRKLNNTKGADSPCGGCHYLKSGDWPELGGHALFNQVEISNFTICNLRCNYCYTVLHEDWNFPSYAYKLGPVFNDMIEKGYLHDQTRIEWAGGEPTILENFEDLQKMFIAHGYSQTIFTNAVVFSEGIAQGLRSRKMSIVSSIDSGTPETYRKVKGRDYFHRVWLNLDRYIQTGGDLVIKYLVKDDNVQLKDLNGFLRLCRKYRVPMISIAPDNNEVSVNRVLDAALKGAAYMAWKARRYGFRWEIQSDYFKPGHMELIHHYMHPLEIAKFKTHSWLAKRFTFLFKQPIKEQNPTSEEIKPEMVTGSW
ncbi:MAG TPA: radical SAM protein [Desulfatiglandales bacterium]|nr:radical SAM protein [Desulfatiglandales bacterium]